MDSPKGDRRSRPISVTGLVAAGAIVFGLAVLAYAAARSTGPFQVLLGWPARPPSSLPTWATAPWTHTLLGAFPSYAHAFAFSVWTIAAWPRTRVASSVACAFWASVNVVFEIGQHPALSTAWAHEAASWPAGSVLSVYWLRGSFQWHDVAAALMGAACAYVLGAWRVSSRGGA